MKVARLADEHHADGGSDERRDLLAGRSRERSGTALAASALGAASGSSTPQNARLFAMVSLAAADGAIGCWNDKYYWSFWRPMEAIREAGTDGNPATEADPGWRPLFDPSTATTPPLATPPFPDHPSGHSCVSGADAPHDAGLLRHGQDRVRHRQPPLPRAATALRALLARAEGESSTRASGAGSTSAPPTRRER